MIKWIIVLLIKEIFLEVLYLMVEMLVPNQQNQMNFSNTVFEQSYIENILRLNRGKKVEIYASYPDSNEWRDRVFKGIVEQSGRDHIILSDPKTGKLVFNFNNIC